MNIVQISCGTSHSLALDYNGKVYSTGSTDYGQMGVDHYNFDHRKSRLPFVELNFFGPKLKCLKLQASDGFSVFLDEYGSLFTCGKGNFGRLGQGTNSNITRPKQIDWFTRKYVKIKDFSAGGRHCLAMS